MKAEYFAYGMLFTLFAGLAHYNITDRLFPDPMDEYRCVVEAPGEDTRCRVLVHRDEPMHDTLDLVCVQEARLTGGERTR